jgi:hypothetical protein
MGLSWRCSNYCIFFVCVAQLHVLQVPTLLLHHPADLKVLLPRDRGWWTM